MSLLTLVEGVCDEVGIPRPSSVVGNTDPGVRQLLRLAQREGKFLRSRHRWNKCLKEGTLTTLAAASQGTLASIASDFDYLVGDTMWNRTTDRPIPAISPEQWQAYQANSVTGPFTKFRIQQGTLYFFPTPTAGHSVAFEYMSKNFCESSGGTDQNAWAADADVGLLDEDLMGLGVVWRWKKAKGLEYGEDFNEYETQVANAISRDNPQPRLSLTKYRRAGRFIGEDSVPEGNWSI